MTDPVSAVAGQTVALDPSLLLDGRGVKGPSSALDKQAFLKLLVAQLKYQDPMKPTSNEEFIATTAQFTTIEKLDEMAKHGAAAAQVSSLATASALVGRQVSVMSEDGTLQTTTVLRGQFSAGNLSLVTDRGSLALDQIVAIGPAPLNPPVSPVAGSGTATAPAGPAPSAAGTQTTPATPSPESSSSLTHTTESIHS